jgi:long-chain acyl-CoA synthetase
VTTSVETPEVLQRCVVGRGEALFPDEPETLAELFLRAASKHDRPNALSYKRDGVWRHISSKRLIERIGHIALGLYALGLRKSDRVAILATNSPEWTLTDAACQFAGLLDVPIYPTLAESSVRYILNDSGARVFVIENLAAYKRIRESIAGCDSIEKFVLFDMSGVNIENAMAFEEVEECGRQLQAERPDLFESLIKSTTADDIATIIYTSGTTGEPKGVMLTHTNVISNVFDAGEKYEFSQDDVSL